MAGRPPHKPKRAKVFGTGRSQAVRLPKDYWRSFGPVGDDFEKPEPLPPTPYRDRAVEGL